MYWNRSKKAKVDFGFLQNDSKLIKMFVGEHFCDKARFRMSKN